jgi:hypothetical protein
MKDLEIGQVLSLKIRFNNAGDLAIQKHPYLIVDIDLFLNIVEIAQIDSLAGKEYKAARKFNKTIFCDNPHETVIDKDSYVQLDNSLKIEYFNDLSKFRRQKDKLSEGKLNSVLAAYKRYHNTYEIADTKDVYMTKDEVLELNT